MTFIAVVFGFMVVSILFIHRLTAHFGYRLDYRSLALCAVMAIVVTVGAILTSKTLTWQYYLKLSLFTLIASGIVTLYDRRITGSGPPLAVAGADDGLAEADEPPVLEKASSKTDSEARLSGEDAGHEDFPEVEAEVSKPVDAANAPLEEGVPVESAKPAVSVLDLYPQEVPGELSGTESMPEPVAGDSTETDSTLKQLGSLDDILDYAYEQRSKGNIEEAIIANQTALERYAEDDYAPYIAIELGNIYKERAQYDSAIEVYEKALDIPSVTGDESTYQEFAKNLSYLRAVLRVLSNHNAQDTPFGKIPQEYMEEIEADFQSRHN